MPRIDIGAVLAEKAPRLARWVPGFVLRWLRRTIHEPEINYILEHYWNLPPQEFIRACFREWQVTYSVEGLEKLDPKGRYLFASNHPFGGMDGMMLADKLIDRFGDFAAVLEASEEELCTVEGVGPASARMLHLLPQICRYYGRSRTSTTRCIKTTEQMGSYLMAKFAWSDYERAMLVSLDSRKRVRAAVWLREGTSDRVSLDIKDVVAAAIKGGTDAVVLCHNHPNGMALPSREDIQATENIVRALGLVRVHLRDHIILTESEYFSMRDENRLPFYDFATGEMLRPY